MQPEHLQYDAHLKLTSCEEEKKKMVDSMVSPYYFAGTMYPERKRENERDGEREN